MHSCLPLAHQRSSQSPFTVTPSARLHMLEPTPPRIHSKVTILNSRRHHLAVLFGTMIRSMLATLTAVVETVNHQPLRSRTHLITQTITMVTISLSLLLHGKPPKRTLTTSGTATQDLPELTLPIPSRRPRFTLTTAAPNSHNPLRRSTHGSCSMT